MCRIQNCGCNTQGNPVICYKFQSTSTEPESTLNITVNNTEHPQGYERTSTLMIGVNNITAFKEHLVFTNSPKTLSGKDKNVILKLSDEVVGALNNLEGNYYGETIEENTFNDQDYI